jgi:hypothetical protein
MEQQGGQASYRFLLTNTAIFIHSFKRALTRARENVVVYLPAVRLT